MRRKTKVQIPQTTAAQLSAIIKACRDIMRKDKGLNGDADRLPMLTWIMFLKFLDDMEVMRETESKMEGKNILLRFMYLIGGGTGQVRKTVLPVKS